jgi:hypothetical protein
MTQKMDFLYYSNYCKHSQKLLQYLVKNNLTNRLNCINIDRRKRNPHTNQMQVFLDNGTTVMLPLNIHSVPSVLLVNDKYRVIVGEEIYKHFLPKVSIQNEIATNYNGEPEAYVLGAASNVVSEQYTFYGMTPDELSAKGRGGMRQMYNYVPAMDNGFTIPTPPDTYRPDKINEDSVEKLQQKRNEDLGFMSNGPPPSSIQQMPPPPPGQGQTLQYNPQMSMGPPPGQNLQYNPQMSMGPPPGQNLQYNPQMSMGPPPGQNLQYNPQMSMGPPNGIPMPPIQNLTYPPPQTMTQPPSYSPNVHPSQSYR